MDWMDCDGLRWIALEWLAELTPIQTPFTLMLLLITHDARAPIIQVRALETAPRAQNGNAARSKRRYALKPALRVQPVLQPQPGAVRSTGAARSLRRYALKTALRAQNGAARSNEVRQGVGRLVRRGRQGSAD